MSKENTYFLCKNLFKWCKCGNSWSISSLVLLYRTFKHAERSESTWWFMTVWPFLERHFQKHIFCHFLLLWAPHTADADGAGSAGCFAFTLYFLHTSHHWQHSQSCSRHKRSSLIENCSEHGFLFGRKRQKLLNTRGHKISPKALPPSSSSSSC